MVVAVAEVARLIGLRGGAQRASPLALAASVERGLPLASLGRVAKLYAPDDPAFAYRLIPKATLARRRSKRQSLTREESEKVERLARLWTLAEQVWQNAGETRRFLTTPHPLLNDRSPLDLAQTAPGARIVEDLLGRLAYGSAV